MTRKLAVLISVLLITALCLAGELPGSSYKAVAPISHGSLTIFPVLAARTHDTSGFLTLDEGLRSGAVVVTEAGRIAGLVRRPRPIPVRGGDVNRLMLVNNSDHPLLLLAGEIVTGGKQDRVIAKDRIVPPHSDPIDLGVFCVEPGRWTGASSNFSAKRAPMAQPSVRGRAMAVCQPVNRKRLHGRPDVPDAEHAAGHGDRPRLRQDPAQRRLQHATEGGFLP